MYDTACVWLELVDVGASVCPIGLLLVSMIAPVVCFCGVSSLLGCFSSSFSSFLFHVLFCISVLVLWILGRSIVLVCSSASVLFFSLFSFGVFAASFLLAVVVAVD